MAEFRSWAEAMAEGAQRAGMAPAVVQDLQQVRLNQALLSILQFPQAGRR